MYGTIGHFHLPGSVAAYCYHADAGERDYYIAVVFSNKEAYFAHAQHPEVAAIDERLMELLECEPEWCDGEVVYAMQ